MLNNPSKDYFRRSKSGKEAEFSGSGGGWGAAAAARGPEVFTRTLLRKDFQRGALKIYKKRDISILVLGTQTPSLGLILFLGLSECIYFPIFRLVNLVGLTHFLVAS